MSKKRTLLSAMLGLLLLAGVPVMAAAVSAATSPGSPAAASDAGRGWFMPPAASNQVRWVDGPMDFINYVTVFFFVLIVVVMVAFAIKFRRRTPDQKATSSKSHSIGLELSWTLPPFAILMACFVMGFRGYMAMNTMPDDGYTIDVTAQQFSWTFQHPNGLVESGQVLDIPAGKPIIFRLTSKDVIHSMFVPDFRVKKDVVRGRFTFLWFSADRPTPFADATMPTTGKEFDELVSSQQTALTRAKLEDEAKDKHTLVTDEQVEAAVKAKLATATSSDKTALATAAWEAKVAANGHLITCAEMCGFGHSLMMARIVVHKPDWKAPAPKLGGSLAEQGERLFTAKGCAACHMPPPGVPQQCPPFAEGIYGHTAHVSIGIGGQTKDVKVDDAYVLESILNPLAKIVVGYNPIMPPGLATPEEAQKILAYLKTIKAK